MEQQLSDAKHDEFAAYILELVIRELEGQDQDLVRISICLGIVEAALTAKSEQRWPTDVQVRSF